MIKTPRLLIKPWTEGDAAAFYELSRDAGFTLFPITVYRQESIETALEWIRGTKAKLAVWEAESGKLLGMGGLTPWTYENEKMIDIT